MTELISTAKPVAVFKNRNSKSMTEMYLWLDLVYVALFNNSSNDFEVLWCCDQLSLDTGGLS